MQSIAREAALDTLDACLRLAAQRRGIQGREWGDEDIEEWYLRAAFRYWDALRKAGTTWGFVEETI